jgi:hypothetical protein
VRHPGADTEDDTMDELLDIDHVPTDQEAAEARWLLSLPDEERRRLMDLADAREAGHLES